MGYNSLSTNTQLIAKLTPEGRRLLITNTNSLITSFALADDDANYNTTNGLPSGKIPAMGGDLGINGTASNSTGLDTALRYPIYYNSVGSQTKPVDPASVNVRITLDKISPLNITIGNDYLTQNLINRNDYTTDELTNLFTSFGLPLTSEQLYEYSSKTFAQGGWSDTALSGVSADTILVIGIDNSQYGEALDGREICLTIETSAGTYTLYSTFQNTGINTKRQDSNYKETSNTTRGLGLSLGFMMSDDILRPNGGDPTLSWATGFGELKPFSVGKKEMYNLTTNANLDRYVDTVTGIAYLDKGFIVITDPTITGSYNAAYSATTATTVTMNSVATEVAQNITCVAGRGEFSRSLNPTWGSGDPIRISALGLYDNQNRLIAYGKFDRHVIRNSEAFQSFGVKIVM